MKAQNDRGSRIKNSTTSIRKIEANRRNSMKSTGPRTLRGKTYSRQNAIKHGLFALDTFPDFLRRETSQEFQELLDRLREHYEPLGIAEELEVERIAVCWWRRKRAWRFENAGIFCRSIDVAEIEYGLKDQRAVIKTAERELFELLNVAKKEIESNGAISPEVREKMFKTMPCFPKQWALLQDCLKRNDNLALQEAMSLLCVTDMAGLPSEHASIVDAAAINLAMDWIKSESRQDVEMVANVGYDHKVLPDHDGMERILRYEAAINRDLSRALDRLERLQRRRKGELLPPPLSVHLTR